MRNWLELDEQLAVGGGRGVGTPEVPSLLLFIRVRHRALRAVYRPWTPIVSLLGRNAANACATRMLHTISKCPMSIMLRP